MFSSGILTVAIGLVFTFLVISLAASAATEMMASVLKWRAHTLFKGVKDLVNDPKFEILGKQLYQHGLINPRGDGGVPSFWERWSKGPAYIQPNQFAAAFLDIVKGLSDSETAQVPATAPNPAPVQQQAQDLKAKVDKKLESNDQIRIMLHGMIDRAEGRSRRSAWSWPHGLTTQWIASAASISGGRRYSRLYSP
ncbi:MAG: hypothetical protein ABSC06_39690 [Rhodopila sp.]|jgi:hypothetical protein